MSLGDHQTTGGCVLIDDTGVQSPHTGRVTKQVREVGYVRNPLPRASCALVEVYVGAFHHNGGHVVAWDDSATIAELRRGLENVESKLGHGL